MLKVLGELVKGVGKQQWMDCWEDCGLVEVEEAEKAHDQISHTWSLEEQKWKGKGVREAKCIGIRQNCALYIGSTFK